MIMRLLFLFSLLVCLFLVGHVVPVPSATDKDGNDNELIYWLDKPSRIPFELVSFGLNQIGR
jgi:hypothetical protein